jgi:hypothetical protein
MNPINEFLLELFRAHGVEAVAQEEWVTFRDRKWKAAASIVRALEQQAGTSVQLDVRLEIAPGRTIIESFAGVGETREKAVADALHNFTVNSLHVLLAAFFHSDDPQVSQEQWVVGGRTSRVTIGNVGIRGKPPVQGEPLVGWFRRFEDKLKKTELRPATHWVRLYYAHMEGKTMDCEVLLDNNVWEDMQSEMAALDWPSGDDFYSVRVFLVIEVQPGGIVTPDTAVAWLADILASWDEFTEDGVYSALADAGVPGALADRAYKFTQIAWGRSVLARLGVQSSRLAERSAGAPGFRRLALMSADVRTVNKALNRGSKPEDLVGAPAFLFLEAPTAAGMANARRAIDQHMAAGPAASATPKPARAKPWWRFWS